MKEKKELHLLILKRKIKLTLKSLLIIRQRNRRLQLLLNHQKQKKLRHLKILTQVLVMQQALETEVLALVPVLLVPMQGPVMQVLWVAATVVMEEREQELVEMVEPEVAEGMAAAVEMAVVEETEKTPSDNRPRIDLIRITYKSYI